MIFDDIEDLGLICVLDRGVPNKECIAFKVRADIDLGAYGVMLGLYDNGQARPIRDSLYWFGNGRVKEGDWILLYTGGGSPRSREDEGGNKTYVVFWGRSKTIFGNSQMVPVLFRMDAIAVGEPEDEKEQIGDKMLAPPSSSQLRIGT